MYVIPERFHFLDLKRKKKREIGSFLESEYTFRKFFGPRNLENRGKISIKLNVVCNVFSLDEHNAATRR